MTSLFVTLVAIVLFSIISLISIVYIDADNARAVTRAPVVAASIGNMVEAVANYKAAMSALPTSVVQLGTAVAIPQLPSLPGVGWVIDSGRICLSLPTSTDNTDLLNATAARLGPSATVSTTCGTNALTGLTAVSIAA